MKDEQLALESIRLAILGPQSGPITLHAAPTNVVDLHGKPYYAPGTLARTLNDIAEAFPRVPTDG